MHNESSPSHHRLMMELGFVFPWTSLVAVIGSVLVYWFGGTDLVWLAYALGGLGVGLGIAYFILSIVRAHSRSGGRTAVSLILGLLLMAFAGFAIFAENFVANFSPFGPPEPPSLAAVLENAAETAAGPASAFLKTGASGPLIGANWTESHWTNPDGGAIPIAISWTRNAQGILITASPVGTVPEGQDGSPRTQQVFANGMIHYPLDFFEQQGKEMQSRVFDFLSPEFFFFNDLVQETAKPIIDFAKEHDGKLPAEAEGARLLSSVKKVFEFNDNTTREASDASKVRVAFSAYTYHPLKDGVCTIDYDWEYSQPNNPPKGNPDFKARGVFSIHYTADGKIAMEPGDKNNPFFVFLGSVERQGSEEEAREDKAENAAKDTKKERPDTTK